MALSSGYPCLSGVNGDEDDCDGDEDDCDGDEVDYEDDCEPVGLSCRFCNENFSLREVWLNHEKTCDDFCITSENSELNLQSSCGADPSPKPDSYQIISGDGSDEETEENLKCQSEIILNCKFCKVKFGNRSDLVSHEKSCDRFYVIPKHTSSPDDSSAKGNPVSGVIKCKFCSKAFSLKKNCNRHEQTCQKNSDSSAAPVYTCDYCGSTSKRKDNFEVHRKKCEEKHSTATKQQSSNDGNAATNNGCNSPQMEQEQKATQSSANCKKKSKTPCLFPDCDLEFYHKISLIEHLQSCHDEADIKDSILKQFDTTDEFLKWKDEVQESTFSYFSQKKGVSVKNSVKHFYCQHDGLSHSKRKTNRINSKGRVKVGHYCIAKMKVWQDSEKKINVEYYPTHNHKCSSQDFIHHPVSKDTDNYINERLCWGVSPTKVLKDVIQKHIPKSFSVDQIRNCKAAVLSKKRIRERARKMREKKRYHKDEAKALFLLVKQLHNEEDSILLYKPFNLEVQIGPKEIDELPDSRELFMLGIQSKRQAQLMAENSHKIVLVDETHGTNHHKYQLLSLMVIDDNRRGWPVGHLITSKSDAKTLQYFFKVVKGNLPKNTKLNCVISDDDPALINSMEMGFSETLRHILCKWHLFKNFKKNLRSYVPKSMVETMMTELKIIVNEPDEAVFLKLQEGFIKKYESLPQCKSFITDYYIKYYKNRASKWAMCYRSKFPHANIDTTGHIESFHHRLKRVYLKRKVNRRLDDLLNHLVELEWDDHLTRIREAGFGFAFQPQDILSRHTRAMKQIEDGHLKQVDVNTWDVKASSGSETYHIVRYNEKCCSDHCFSRCTQISCSGLCAHLYCCSCPDNHPLCKHIHKLHSILIRDTVKQVRDNECADDCLSRNDPTNTSNEACQVPPSVDDTLGTSLTSSRIVVRHCRELEGNLTFLSDILSSGKSDAISRAATITNDLVLQLKYMGENEDVEKITHMQPAVKFNSNETLKTQASQISSFRRPPKRKAKPKEVSPTKKRAVIKDLLDVFSDSGEHHPSKFTPRLSFAANPRDVLLKCGQETITLLNLKTLELDLSDEERKKCMELDPAFNVGWISSSIINTFLSRLERKHSSCAAVSSDLAFRASRGMSNVKQFQRLKGKELFLLPANLSGTHWCIAAVVILSSSNFEIQYYDPLQRDVDQVTARFLLQLTADFTSLSSTASTSEVLYVQAEKQNDGVNCGVHICSYADHLFSMNEPYHLVSDINAFRQYMYKEIVGGCLKHERSEEESCGICHKKFSDLSEDDGTPWISCKHCEQWYHIKCVRHLLTSHPFTCPV